MLYLILLPETLGKALHGNSPFKISRGKAHFNSLVQYIELVDRQLFRTCGLNRIPHSNATTAALIHVPLPTRWLREICARVHTECNPLHTYIP
jgi:hypothetical protein